MTAGGFSVSSDTPTPEFRWLDVGGTQNVLQQRWEVRVSNENTKASGVSHEWRNVPVVLSEKRKR